MSLCPSVGMGEAESPKLPSPGHLLPAKWRYSHTTCLFLQVILLTFPPSAHQICSFPTRILFYLLWILDGFEFSLCDEGGQAHSRWVSLMLNSKVFDTLPGSSFWPLHISTYICFLDHRQASSRVFYYTSVQVTLFFFNFSSNIQIYANF